MKVIQVYCNQTTDEGVWTVFKRRTDGIVCFFCDWDYYKQSFGNLQNEFWFGNENSFALTLQGLYSRSRGKELRINMMNVKKVKKSVWHANLHINNATAK